MLSLKCVLWIRTGTSWPFLSPVLFGNVCVGLVNSQEDPPRLLRGIHKTPESTGVLTERLTFQTAVLKVSGPRRDCLTQHRGDKCLTQQTHPWNSERLTSGSVRYVREMWKELDTKQTADMERWEGRVRTKRWPGRSWWGLRLNLPPGEFLPGQDQMPVEHSAQTLATHSLSLFLGKVTYHILSLLSCAWDLGLLNRETWRGPVSDELFAPGCYLHSEQRLNLSHVHQVSSPAFRFHQISSLSLIILISPLLVLYSLL